MLLCVHSLVSLNLSNFSTIQDIHTLLSPTDGVLENLTRLELGISSNEEEACNLGKAWLSPPIDSVDPALNPAVATYWSCALENQSSCLLNPCIAFEFGGEKFAFGKHRSPYPMCGSST